MSATAGNGATPDPLPGMPSTSPYWIGKRTSELLRIATAG